MRRTIAIVTAMAASGLLTTPALADDPDDALADLSESAWQESVTALADNVTPLTDNITALAPGITSMDTRTTEGEETVISLASDVLFEFGEASITDQAEARIRELVADAPDGATVLVHGHTDSVGEDDFNQRLSEDRAGTVADVIEAARPDLVLEVEGFGETDPVEPNEVDGEDNPEGRALNRRVEIRYDG